MAPRRFTSPPGSWWATRHALISGNSRLSSKQLTGCLWSLGTHPIPRKYLDLHNKLPFWPDHNIAELAGPLLDEDPEIMDAYN